MKKYCLLLLAMLALLLSACNSSQTDKNIPTNTNEPTNPNPTVTTGSEETQPPAVPPTGNAEGTLDLSYVSTTYENVSGYMISARGTSSEKNIVVPSTYKNTPVLEIASYALQNCDFVQSIVISDGLRSIGEEAFFGCDNLTQAILPNGITVIKQGTFRGCRSLESIVIPDSVQIIEESAFADCTSLKNVTFGSASQLQSIGSYAFKGCSALKSISLPDRLTILGENCFYYCTVLASVNVGEQTQLSTIKASAFEGCQNLTHITLPSSITSIESNAFLNCRKLVEVDDRTSLNIQAGQMENGRVGAYALHIISAANPAPSRLTTTPEGYVFYTQNESSYLLSYLGSETALTLPKSFNEKGYAVYQSAFEKQAGLTKVIIPDGVTSIGKFAFSDCINLKEISLPDSLQTIGEEAFYDCSSLEAIQIPDGIGSVQASTFNGCTDLKRVILPDSLVDIGYWAFTDCIRLETVEIGENCRLKNIGYNAFANCRNLTSFVLPASMQSIDQNAFSGCRKLVEVWNLASDSFDTQAPCKNARIIHHSMQDTSLIQTTSEGYVFFVNGSTVYLIDYKGTETALTLPANHQGTAYAVSAYAFASDNRITSVVIPDSVIDIGEGAFYGCLNLIQVTLPSTLQGIPQHAFKECYSLAFVNIPTQVTKICTGAFEKCYNLMTVTLPAGLKEIENLAFDGCQKLIEVRNHSELEIQTHAYGFGNVGYYAKVIYTADQAQTNLHKTNDGYVFYEDGDKVYLLGYVGTETNLVLPKDFNGEAYIIYRYAFYGRSGLEGVVIPTKVSNFGSFVFHESGITLYMESASAHALWSSEWYDLHNKTVWGYTPQA